MKKRTVFIPASQYDGHNALADNLRVHQRPPEDAPSKPGRVKVRRELKFVLMALVLVVSILLGSVVQSFRVTPYITNEDVQDFTGLTGTITDRFGKPIYQNGEVIDYGLFGNVVGYRDYIHNSLLYVHSETLMPDPVNPIVGHTSLETQPRVMTTTLLSAESLQEIAKLYNGLSGCCYAYNYETGEVYAALSFPSFDPSAADTTYLNRCISSVYVPGSTMKIVTAALAVDQGKNVNKLKYECKQTVVLDNGDEIKCVGYHGKIDFATAIGKSCNCYFAQLIMDLNLEKALATLKEMGFSVNGDTTRSDLLDGLTVRTSSVNMTNTASFKNIWGLIGQGETQVSPIMMAQIAAATVNGGKAAVPYMIASIDNPNVNKRIYEAKTETVTLMSESTAKKTAAVWKQGVDANYYTNQGMSSRIDYAKTGTAERNNGREDKLLMGVIESSKTAFYIVVENGGSKLAPMTVANKLATLLPSYSE